MNRNLRYHPLVPVLLGIALLASPDGFAQSPDSVRWLTFEQLDDSLAVHPKKVFIAFHADWCTPCRKMDRVAFQDPRVVAALRADYYAVKMNVESEDTIAFGNQVFVNERINKPNPVHQIPLLMARQREKPFSLPAMVVLDENFEATARYFQYLDAQQMMKVLK